MTIPGISYTSASAILAEIGDINVFPCSKSLVGVEYTSGLQAKVKSTPCTGNRQTKQETE
jgi:transposase